MDVNNWYSSIIREILAEGAREVNKRTGMECAAVAGATFRTDLERDGFPLLALRKISVKNFVAEQMWFIAGRDNVNDFLNRHTRIWDAFAETDGRVTSAYGRRWRKRFGVDQLETTLLRLHEDPSSRHGVVASWHPMDDLSVRQKNVPCPVMFTVNIIGGRLNLHLVVRSNDMVLGFPTDCAGFAWLAMVLAQNLGVRPGIYTHSISNAHVYENHYEAAATMADRHKGFELYFPLKFDTPKDSYQRACALDDSLVADTVAAIEPHYEPEPAITGLIISK
jgi:thymidylate synthase